MLCPDPICSPLLARQGSMIFVRLMRAIQPGHSIGDKGYRQPPSFAQRRPGQVASRGARCHAHRMLYSRLKGNTMTYLTHLECADCATTYDTNTEQHRCACGGILL